MGVSHPERMAIAKSLVALVHMTLDTGDSTMRNTHHCNRCHEYFVSLVYLDSGSEISIACSMNSPDCSVPTVDMAISDAGRVRVDKQVQIDQLSRHRG